jgi:hypothetical protein
MPNFRVLKCQYYNSVKFVGSILISVLDGGNKKTDALAYYPVDHHTLNISEISVCTNQLVCMSN